jgi:large subunit ribosomal protein L24
MEEGTVHISNVLPVDPTTGKPGRTKVAVKDGNRTRVFVKSGNPIA